MILLLLIFLIIHFTFSDQTIFIIATLLPFSIDKINYFNEVNKQVVIDEDIQTEYLDSWKIDDIEQFLDKLDENSNYIADIEFYPSLVESHMINIPRLLISDSIIINSLSSETTIAKFINERLEIMIDLYYLDDSILQHDINDGPVIVITYTKFI